MPIAAARNVVKGNRESVLNSGTVPMDRLSIARDMS
jgi:hypothetical protein